MQEDPPQYVKSLTRPVTFSVGFENLANATAPAVNVKLVVHLGSSYNASTARLVSSSAPGNLATFKESANNSLTVLFSNLNLQPDVNPPQGEGWITFTVLPDSNVSQNTRFSSSATVYFDSNPPVTTNAISQIYDSLPPTTTVQTKLDNSTLQLSISGTSRDNGSGVAQVMVTVMGANSTQSSRIYTNGSFEASVTLAPGQKYNVFAIGSDQAGNVENKTSADSVVSIPNMTQTSSASTQITSSTSSGAPPSGSMSSLIATVAVVVVIGVIAGIFLIKKRKQF